MHRIPCGVSAAKMRLHIASGFAIVEIAGFLRAISRFTCHSSCYLRIVAMSPIFGAMHESLSTRGKSHVKTGCGQISQQR